MIGLIFGLIMYFVSYLFYVRLFLSYGYEFSFLLAGWDSMIPLLMSGGLVVVLYSVALTGTVKDDNDQLGSVPVCEHI